MSENSGVRIQNSEQPLVTIVVPVKDWNDQVIECARRCLLLEHTNFELWLVPDHLPSESIQRQLDDLADARIQIVHVGPAITPVQRNRGLLRSRTDLVAFTDSDAYPRPDWLTRALALLQGEVGAVGGPNLVPSDASWMEKVADHVMRSPLGYGAAFIRHVPCSRRFVAEIPTCNFVLRRMSGCVLPEHLHTGDDMVFCAEIRARSKKILYDPEVVVFHHRRKIYKPLMTQFHLYGVYKGVLFRSRHEAAPMWNAAPAGLVFYWFALIPWVVLERLVWGSAWMVLPGVVYLAAILFESVRLSGVGRECRATLTAFVLCHFAYGIGFWRGILRTP